MISYVVVQILFIPQGFKRIGHKRLEFVNVNFVRGQPQLMQNIQRRN